MVGVSLSSIHASSFFLADTETLRKDYKQDTKMAFVMKAIYTMAWGLHNMQRALCRPGQGLCKAMLPINGSLYMDYLMNVTFSYHDETVTFDSRGDPPGRYNIMNYQLRADGSYEYVLVGMWDNGTLDINHTLVEFNTLDSQPPISVCSDPCRYNEFKSGDGTQMCCWVCTPCLENQYLKNETACEDCQPGYTPNLNMTGCDAIPVEHLTWDAPESIASLTLACLGLLATCFTMTVFIKYNHTPVVKASTRELSYIIFVGMMVSYCATLPLLARPSPVACAASRVLPGLSFAMIYAALVTKTNRIARILAGNKKITMRKPRFMSATAQVVITCGLIGIELGIIIAMLILDPPNSRHDYPNLDQVMLVCNTTNRAIIAPLAWDFFLILMCTVYAVKTRNLPENFNEAKFIGFSMYTTCVIWLAWFPIYFGSRHKIICMSMCTSLSALVTLVLLFFPKLYIILFRPEKNDRSAFKTAKTVRCHIGSSNKTSLSRPSDTTPSAAVESMYVGSAMLGLMPPQLTLMQRLKTSLAAAPFLASATAGAHARSTLKREISVWSDASGSGGGAAASARDAMLRRAYGSQLDLSGEAWSGVLREERACQTTEDLLDSLIPRLRRRVVRAVRENKLDATEGREFFSLTHGWMTSQAEAARNEMRRGDTDPEKVATAAAAIAVAAAAAAASVTTAAVTTTTTTTTAASTTTTATTRSYPSSVHPNTPAATTSTTSTQSDHPTTTTTSTNTSTTPTEHSTPALVITTVAAATTPASITTTTTTTSFITTPTTQNHIITITTTPTPTTNNSSGNNNNNTTSITTSNNSNNTNSCTVVPARPPHPSAPCPEATTTTTTTTTSTSTSTSTTPSTAITSTNHHQGEAGPALPAATTTTPHPTMRPAASQTPVTGRAWSQRAGEGMRAGEDNGGERQCVTRVREVSTVGRVNGEEAAGCQGVSESDGAGLMAGDGALRHPDEALGVECQGRVLEGEGPGEAGWAPPLCSAASKQCSGERNLAFVGYAPPMPCVAGGGDGAGGWTATPDPSTGHVPMAEATMEGAAWGGGGDCEKLLVEVKPRGARRVEVLGRREGRHRRRKVGVTARVADVRGILRCVAFPRTDKTARVSFDTPAANESATNRVGQPRPPRSRQDSGDSGEQEAPFSILEESDAEASDSCEMKTIIIRLGSGGGEEEGVGSNGGSGGGGSEGGGGRGRGPFINWRPRLGRNHPALSRPNAATPRHTAPRPGPRPGPSHPNQRSSELVILDLLRRNKGQGARLPSPPPTSEPPLDQIILPPPRQYSPAAAHHHPPLHNHVHTELPPASPIHDTDDGSTTPIEEFFLNHGVRFDATSATSKKL
ncbi:LOW QUALITY PROTEIN: uncharacterized protein LOC127005337 [Eriocheir sinensis]|uniref:LOW QUALITY PROTEIN: uncharacterized protein LOC127005337 n=1 Tax=Eriocheir sinensis TaxID=95602 RepID=UPI0021C571A4|nr:LOW QUALITY PROTEIN: uncharacterized protein LOC127005337 [Eriocheir sinensis]